MSRVYGSQRFDVVLSIRRAEWGEDGKHSVHWTPGTAASRRARFTSIFLASSSLCSQAESNPAPAPVTPTIWRLKNKSNSNLSVVPYVTTGGLEVIGELSE
jgi:hypothetical protein